MVEKMGGTKKDGESKSLFPIIDNLFKTFLAQDVGNKEVLL